MEEQPFGFQGEALHIVHEPAYPDGNISPCIGQRFDHHRHVEGVCSFLDLPADIASLPFIPIGDMGKLGNRNCFIFSGFRGAELAVDSHFPLLSACSARDVETERMHLIFSMAVGTLIEDLVQSFRSFFEGDRDPVFFLPSILIVFERAADPRIELIDREGFRFLYIGDQKEVACDRNAPFFQVPDGTVQVVSVHIEHDHGNTQQLADLPQRIGQNGGGPAEGISCLRIQGENVAIGVQDFFDVPHDLEVIGEFAFADSTGVSQEPFTTDESVDRDYVVRSVGEEGGCRHFEVDERHMGTEQEERRLDAFRPSPRDGQAPQPYLRITEQPGKRAQIMTLGYGVPFHIKAFCVGKFFKWSHGSFLCRFDGRSMTSGKQGLRQDDLTTSLFSLDWDHG